MRFNSPLTPLMLVVLLWFLHPTPESSLETTSPIHPSPIATPPVPYPTPIIMRPDTLGCPPVPPEPTTPCPYPKAIMVAPPSGLQDVEFNTTSGVVKLRLPVAVLAGETVSGSLSIHPMGTGDESTKNEALLKQHVIRVGDIRITVEESQPVLNLPPSRNRSTIPVSLVDSGDKVVETKRIYIQSPKSPLAKGPRPESFFVPSIGAVGQELTIAGKFDGDRRTTQVLFNGTTAKIVGESPHGLTTLVPAGPGGQTELIISESGKTYAARGFYSARLEIDGRNIKVGTTAEVPVRIAGLKGDDVPVGVVVRNLAPPLLELVGGNEQLFWIKPPASGGKPVVITLQVVGKKVGRVPLRAEFVTSSLAAFAAK